MVVHFHDAMSTFTTVVSPGSFVPLTSITKLQVLTVGLGFLKSPILDETMQALTMPFTNKCHKIITGCQPFGRYPGPSHIALKKWNVVSPEKRRKVNMLISPPQPDSGGHHIVLLQTVANDTHLIIPVKSVEISILHSSQLLNSLGTLTVEVLVAIQTIHY